MQKMTVHDYVQLGMLLTAWGIWFWILYALATGSGGGR